MCYSFDLGSINVEEEINLEHHGARLKNGYSGYDNLRGLTDATVRLLDTHRHTDTSQPTIQLLLLPPNIKLHPNIIIIYYYFELFGYFISTC